MYWYVAYYIYMYIGSRLRKEYRSGLGFWFNID